MRLRQYKDKLRLLKKAEPAADSFNFRRQELVNYIKINPILNPSAVSGIGFWWLLKPVYIATICLVLVVLGATSAAAARALPDEPLYPLKRVMEKIQVSLLPSDSAKTQARLVLAEKRIQEAESLLAQQRPQGVITALNGYQEEVEGLKNNLSDINTSNQDKNLLNSARQYLTKQQKRLANIAEQAQNLRFNQQTDLENKLVRVLDENGSRELEMLDKEVVGNTKNIKNNNPPKPPTSPSTEQTPLSDTSDDLVNSSPLTTEIANKIEASNELLQELEPQLAGLTNQQQQEKLTRLYDQAQEALTDANIELTGDNSNTDYLRAYRQAIKACKLSLELQIRLNSFTTDEGTENGDNNSLRRQRDINNRERETINNFGSVRQNQDR